MEMAVPLATVCFTSEMSARITGALSSGVILSTTVALSMEPPFSTSTSVT